MAQQGSGSGFLAGRRVLVTGGLGFIGSNLVRRCLALGARVTVYDSLDPNSGGKLYNVQDVRSDLILHLHDLNNFDRVMECVLEQDVVFNCAASTSHPYSMKEPWINLDTNSRAVINLLEAARRCNPEVKLVHVGTTTQLGRLQHVPADENHPEFPTDIYSANKTVSEKFVLIYARAHRIRATVVRLPNVFGPYAAIHSADFTFNNYFIGLALQDRDLTIFGDGAQLRNVLYVADAVEALILAAAHPGSDGEVYFAVGDQHHSVADIARKTVERIGSGRVNHVPWPAGRLQIDVGDAVISNQKFKSATGWAPTVDLEAGLDLTRTFYLPRKQHYL